MRSGVKAPEVGEFSRIFVVKVTLHKRLGEQDVLVAPLIILLGSQLFPLLPRFPRLCLCQRLSFVSPNISYDAKSKMLRFRRPLIILTASLLTCTFR